MRLIHRPLGELPDGHSLPDTAVETLFGFGGNAGRLENTEQLPSAGECVELISGFHLLSVRKSWRYLPRSPISAGMRYMHQSISTLVAK